MPPSFQPQTPSAQLIRLAQTQQFYWFVGHVLAFLFFVVHTFTLFFRPRLALRYYRFSLVAILLTYLIVIKQVHLKKGITSKRLVRDENVQYFTLAFIFYVASFQIGVINLTLYSFAIFSLFHILGYFQNNLLPIAFPDLAMQQRVSSAISHFSTTYNQPALFVAANAEMILAILLAFQIPVALLMVVFRGRLLDLLVKVFVFVAVVVFNKLRFDANQYTKAVVTQFDDRIREFVVKLSNPRITELHGKVRSQIVGVLSNVKLDEKKTR